MGMFNPAWFRFFGTPLNLPRPPARRSSGTEQFPVWVIHASETGVAEDLAVETCRRLKKTGRATRLLSLEAADPLGLSGCQQELFLASTSGDGEPPYTADGFADRYMRTAASLSTLQFAVLALGDRRYDAFCAFGRRLHEWLLASGARPLFDLLEMDDEDPATSRQWYESLPALAEQLQPRWEDQPKISLRPSL
jgi:sulfite reductase (NADPH) flavoprotein alpha-component